MWCCNKRKESGIAVSEKTRFMRVSAQTSARLLVGGIFSATLLW
jgi:hypothetical protein